MRWVSTRSGSSRVLSRHRRTKDTFRPPPAASTSPEWPPLWVSLEFTWPCCRHYAANSMEHTTEGGQTHTRHDFSATISQQDLVDSYLKPFQRYASGLSGFCTCIRKTIASERAVLLRAAVSRRDEFLASCARTMLSTAYVFTVAPVLVVDSSPSALTSSGISRFLLAPTLGFSIKLLGATGDSTDTVSVQCLMLSGVFWVWVRCG